MRSFEKDNDFVSLFSEKILQISEDFSDCFSFINITTLTSDKIESISKFILLYFSFIINKTNQTPGDEYCFFFKKFEYNFSKKNMILIYILINSFGKLFLKFLYDSSVKFISKIQNKIHLLVLNNDTSKIVLECKFVFILKKFFEKFSLPNFDDIIDKLYEYQLMQFFIFGNYHSWIDWLFKIKYCKISEKINNKNDEEVFDDSSFRFLGILILLKNIWESLLKFKELYNKQNQINSEYEKYKETHINKSADDKIIIKIDENIYEKVQEKTESLKFLNFKVKKTQINFNKENKIKSLPNELEKEDDSIEIQDCLLCMDKIQNLSSTFCGHLFCWDCIMGYLQINNSCPFCRKICFPQNTIRISNLL